MNVLYGLLHPDEGEILVDGQPVTFRSPGDAIKAGIGMVHQHFMLVPVFTVAENVTLGVERTRGLGLLDRRRARRDVRELSERYGLNVNPDADVEDLPVGTQQRVEIIKALLREASVLILDEPTSVLTPGETEDLFRVIRELKAGGRSIVFISHKLKEVQAIAGSVLLDGQALTHPPPRDRLRAGFGYVPEDRQEDGLVPDFTVAENLVLDVYDRPPFASGLALNLDAISANAKSLVDEYDVRTPSAQLPVGTLSGGNQQKVILAREMSRDVRLLLASQPTRGLDVGSIEFVHRRMVEQRDRGVPVLIVSSELDEIYAVGDGIAVMYEGKIVGFRPPSVPVGELGLLMAGVGADGEAGARPLDSATALAGGGGEGEGREGEGREGRGGRDTTAGQS